MMRKLIWAALAAFALLATPAIAADCSGTITTGGTAQTLFTSSNVRRVLLQNNSANVLCYSINGVAATIAGTNCGAGSFALSNGSATAGGGSVNLSGYSISTLSVITATTGDRFTCERQ